MTVLANAKINLVSASLQDIVVGLEEGMLTSQTLVKEYLGKPGLPQCSGQFVRSELSRH